MYKKIVLITIVLSINLSAKNDEIASCSSFANIESKKSSLEKCVSCINNLSVVVGSTEEKIDNLIDECLKGVSLLRTAKDHK
ncbi:hypothetical protein [Sulfurimonas sp.]|jgi:hypothetical protein|uniref:hypothetical protein n=1 Tax=Sulfurimonas sp. TaxID=2022749 RepID=UPI0025F8C0C2|nr:hypothetical protein [Sulfurimonas sp.]MBT5935111.1 hypothetical protein [Sulfurimonas sp.]